MALEVEIFSPIEKPRLRLFGAAANANASGRSLVNIVELIASRYNFVVVIELPQVKCYDGEVEWIVNHDSEVTLKGQIDVGEIFSDVSLGLQRRRVQLCPTEPWMVSFRLPGPVEWWTASVFFTSSTVMELIVEREIPSTELATTSAMATASVVAYNYVVAYASEATTSSVASTSEVATTSAGATTSTLASSVSPEMDDIEEMIALIGSTSPGVDDIDEMIALAGPSSSGVDDIDEMIAGWLI